MPTEIRQIMVADPKTIHPDATVASAFEMMLSGSFRHLPVTADRKVVGILSDRDLLRHMPRADDSPSAHGRFAKQRVVDIMTPVPLTVAGDEKLTSAVQSMLSNNISSILVVDKERRLEGLVTMVDIAALSLRLLK